MPTSASTRAEDVLFRGGTNEMAFKVVLPAYTEHLTQLTLQKIKEWIKSASFNSPEDALDYLYKVTNERKKLFS